MQMDKKNVKEILEAISKNATCSKRKTAALVIKDGVIISIGYNGSVRGADECIDKGCLLPVRHCERCVHAEENCLLNAARIGVSTLGGDLFCLHFPCRNCLRSIVNAGIKKIFFYNDYSDEANKILLAEYLEKKLIEIEKVG